MINKNKIIQILDDPNLGVVQLEFEYGKLSNSECKDFLTILADILVEGSDREKAICFTFIDMIGQSSRFEELIHRHLENRSFSVSPTLINALMWVSAGLSKSWCFDYILEVIAKFRPKFSDYSYLYMMGVRCMIATVQWRSVIDEIQWIIKNVSDEQIIDLLAYFKWKRLNSDYKELLERLGKIAPVALNENLHLLQSKINHRYQSNYAKLNDKV